MVREHGFKGPWPGHLSTRYATHQSLWTAIRGLAQSSKPLPAIAKAMDVDISSWPALDKDDFLIRVLAESSGLPEWDDAMMDGEFQTRSLMITANPSLDPREPQKKGKHKKKAKKSHVALPAPTGLPTNGSPMEEDAPTDNVNSQDKCPGFQFTDRTNNRKVPAHGSPPKPAKKPPTSSSSTAESSSPVTKKKSGGLVAQPRLRSLTHPISTNGCLDLNKMYVSSDTTLDKSMTQRIKPNCSSTWFSKDKDGRTSKS